METRPAPAPAGEYYTLKEAASLCATAVATVRRWIEEDRLTLHRRPGATLVHWKDLRKCLARRGLPVPDGLRTGPVILLVEDDPDQLFVLVESLDGLWEKTRVATAKTGLSALSKLEALKPDLLVTDVALPELDGFELCRRARANRDLPRIKIIVLSGLQEVNTGPAALNCGADEFLPKPAGPDEIRAAALRLLGPGPFGTGRTAGGGP